MPLTISETTATKMLWMIQAAIMDFRLAFIKLQMLPLKNICSYTDAVYGLKTNQKIKILQRDTSCCNMQTRSQQQNSKD